MIKIVGGDFDYETKGHGYAAQRRPDPRIGAMIHAALGDSRSVLNVAVEQPIPRWSSRSGLFTP